MDWTDRLHAAIDYLEDGLGGDIDMERAAALANCSLFHFMRMFEVICGVTPGEYVRRRRLSRAAIDLAAGTDRVIDLALRYGYDSPESFAKAFKRLFSLTPSEARSSGVALTLYPRLRLMVVLQGEQVMQYRIVEKPAFSATGVVLNTTGAEGANQRQIPAFWRAHNSNGTVEALASKAGPMGLLGVCFDYNPRDNSLKYMIGIEKPAGIEGLPTDTISVTMPKATYAVFQSVGQMPKAIQDTWKQVFSEWFPASGYEHAGSPELEVYPQGDVDSPNYRCEVWIPVRKQKSEI